MADPYDTPGYRYSVNEFPGDGTTINWNIQFAGRSPGYISIDHVRASVIDEDGVETPITLSQSNFIQPTLLRIEPAVPAGSVLRVWRDTPKDEPLLDYNDGALMTERNLDTSFDQAVYAAAEMVDRAADSLEDVAEFSEAVLDRLADVEDTSNTALATANTALGTANAAFASAASAVSTANDALAGVVGATEAADLATAAANAANAAATVATTAANNAEQAAQDSLDTAAAALTTASNAQAVALGIDSKAQDALDAAAAAVATANAAESTANGIDAKATQALEDSEDALIAANEALNTAYLRRGPLPSDTTHNLDDWGVDEVGIWYQGSGSWTSAAQNYPAAIAGVLEVLPRTAGRVVQRYIQYLDGRTYIRGQSNAGTWSSWQRLDTVSERDTALGTLAVGFETELLNYALKTDLAGYVPVAEKGAASGVASLNSRGVVPAAQRPLPPLFRSGGKITVSGTTVTVEPGMWRSASDEHNMELSSSRTKVVQTSGGWAAGNTQNGLLTGARTPDTWYHVYAIMNPSTGATDVALSTSLPPTGLPSGWTQWRRLGSVYTTGTNNLLPFIQVGRYFTWPNVRPTVDGATVSNQQLLNMDLPPDVRVRGQFTILQVGGSGFPHLLLVSPEVSASVSTGFADYLRASGYNAYAKTEVITNTSRQIRALTSAASISNLNIGTQGWEDFLED